MCLGVPVWHGSALTDTERYLPLLIKTYQLYSVLIYYTNVVHIGVNFVTLPWKCTILILQIFIIHKGNKTRWPWHFTRFSYIFLVYKTLNAYHGPTLVIGFKMRTDYNLHYIRMLAWLLEMLYMYLCGSSDRRFLKNCLHHLFLCKTRIMIWSN